MTLESVPDKLDPSHPWLRDKNNRANLSEFLTAYGLTPSDVHSARFFQQSFEVVIYNRDSAGNPAWDERRKLVLTHVEKFKYREGLHPRTTREPYIRRD